MNWLTIRRSLPPVLKMQSIFRCKSLCILCCQSLLVVKPDWPSICDDVTSKTCNASKTCHATHFDETNRKYPLPNKVNCFRFNSIVHCGRKPTFLIHSDSSSTQPEMLRCLLHFKLSRLAVSCKRHANLNHLNT